MKYFTLRREVSNVQNAEVKETQGTFFVKTLAESPLILISSLGSYLFPPNSREGPF